MYLSPLLQSNLRPNRVLNKDCAFFVFIAWRKIHVRPLRGILNRIHCEIDCIEARGLRGMTTPEPFRSSGLVGMFFPVIEFAQKLGLLGNFRL